MFFNITAENTMYLCEMILYMKREEVTSNMSTSRLWLSTWQPNIGAQVSNVNTFLMKGSLSPCRITMLEIWITGSWLASGNIPRIYLGVNNVCSSVLSATICLLVVVVVRGGDWLCLWDMEGMLFENLWGRWFFSLTLIEKQKSNGASAGKPN